MKSLSTDTAAPSAIAVARPKTTAECTEASDTTRTLPPDPENMNDHRAKWAQAALRAFQKATGADAHDAVCDLLCDLMHLSDRSEFSFETALERARCHYMAETASEEAP
jgi:hypothetical protein